MELKNPWSYSALTAFETCPRRYELTRVSKVVKEPQTEATIWGNALHKALELFAKDQQPLPEAYAQYEPYVKQILSIKGERIVEEQVALTRELKPTTWMAKDVWVRGIIDIGVVGTDKAYFLDWKTGKRNPDSDQLRLFAALGFARFPHINQITTGFIWLKEDRFDKEVFQRAEIVNIWGDFHPRISRLAHAYDQGRWVPKPSGLCKKWCPVGRDNCEFNGT